MEKQHFKQFISYLRVSLYSEYRGYSYMKDNLERFVYISPDLRDKYLEELRGFENSESSEENIAKIEKLARDINDSFIKIIPGSNLPNDMKIENFKVVKINSLDNTMTVKYE